MNTKAIVERGTNGPCAGARSVFSPIKVADLAEDARARKEAASPLWDVGFSCASSGKGSFVARLHHRVRANGATWDCVAAVPMTVSDNMEKAPVVPGLPKPGIQLEAAATIRQKARALAIAISNTSVICTANDRPADIGVVIKSLRDGAVVKRLSGTAETLGKDTDGTCRCIVAVPTRGVYVVEAVMDTGPLAGEVKALQTVDVP
jgi:hypothetical protein